MQNKRQTQVKPASGLAKHWKWLLALLLLGILSAMLIAWRADHAAPSNSNNPAELAKDDWVNQAKDKAGGPGAEKLAVGATGAASAQRLAVVQKQLELAEHTYNSYKASTKYPMESRPIAEHPDQVYPNRPVEDAHALRKANGQVDSNIKVQTTQSRVFVGAKENLILTVSARDKAGTRMPLFVTRAIARGIANPGQRQAPSVTMHFSDDGNLGDTNAADNIVTGQIIPSATSFANFAGTVRVEVQFNAGDSAGVVNFDFIYTPDVPATWAGAPREAMENGALNFYLPINIQQAGRYLVSGRVDDANGKPFALVAFNDIVQNGSKEIRLPLFGKLIRDQNPTFPLTLRDVEAYLLKEDTDPDRAMLPRLIGTVLVTKKYPVNGFSDAEWDSEQRRRYLQELGKDVEKSRAELEGLKQGTN